MLAVDGRVLDVAAEEMDVAFLGSRGEGVPHQVRRQTRGQADGIPYGAVEATQQRGPRPGISAPRCRWRTGPVAAVPPYLPGTARDSRSYGQGQGGPRFVRSYPARCL